MNASHIKISADSVVELAKNVLRPIKCDWLVGRDVCPVTLGSWTLLQEVRRIRNAQMIANQFIWIIARDSTLSLSEADCSSFYQVFPMYKLKCTAGQNLRSEWQTATCGLPRCNARNHGSTAALENHVRQAHMARVPFPCPIDGMQPVSKIVITPSKLPCNRVCSVNVLPV